MSDTSSSTPTDLLASATKTLQDGGYCQIASQFPDWDTPSSRLFEDPYNVVGLVVFETCDELLRSWPDLQGSLVEVITRHVGQGEAKSWDGYLVLLTSAVAPSGDADIEVVRYNTTRLRKIVATGEDIRTAMDVERVLRPLLPFSADTAKLGRIAVLDLLPKLLKTQGISEETTTALITAFREQESLLERLHKQEAQ